MAGSPPTFNSEVFHGSATGLSTPASSTITLTADVVGNLLLLACIADVTVSSIADSRGNTWASAISIANSGRTNCNVGRMDYPLKTGDTITITWGAGANVQYAISVLDFSNANLTTTSVDVTASATGTSTAPLATTGSTAINDEIVIGVTMWKTTSSGDYSSAGAGFTRRGTIVSHGTQSMAVETKAVSATGTQAVGATLGSSLGWSQLAVAIRGSKTWYIDYNAADDTGAGTSFATAKKNLSALTLLSGDTVHMAKSADPAAQTGTMTFTDNSTSVATSADLTGSLAAKDLIGPYTGSNAITGDGWWEIASLTASTITLSFAYCGTTRTTVTGYKMNGFDAGAVAATSTNVVNTSSTGSLASPIQIIGGYDTSNDTRTFFSYWRGSGASRNGQFTATGGHNIWSYFGNGRLTFGFTTTVRVELRSCAFNAWSSGAVSFNNTGGSSTAILDTFLSTAGAAGSSAVAGTFGVQVSNGTITGCPSAGIALGAGSDHQVVDAVTIRRVGSSGVTSGCPYTIVRNCTISFCTTHGVLITNYGRNRVEGSTFSNNTSADITTSVGSAAECAVFNCAVSSVTTLNPLNSTFIQCDRYNQVAGSWRYLSTLWGVILSNTAAARTGTCVEMQPNWSVSLGGHNQPGACQYTTPIPVDDSGATRTVTVYIKTSSTWNGTHLRVGIRQYFNWISGQMQDLYALYAVPTLYAGWTAYTFTFGAMTERGAIDFCVECDGTAGSVYIDDLTYT